MLNNEGVCIQVMLNTAPNVQRKKMNLKQKTEMSFDRRSSRRELMQLGPLYQQVFIR